ncbi:MAG: hypothetical protein Q3996_01620 [Candidatus Saccharibacteria bacterium]|nr:hypothetical protein [Candidatus Saccharibacteria bacterium]
MKTDKKSKLLNIILLVLLLVNIGFTLFVMCNSNQQIKDLKLELKRANALSYKRLNAIEKKLDIPNPTVEEIKEIYSK